MKTTRTLVRVVSSKETEAGTILRVVVPASMLEETSVRVRADLFPVELRKPGTRFFALATLDAEQVIDMRIEGPFEGPAELDPNDGLG